MSAARQSALVIGKRQHVLVLYIRMTDDVITLTKISRFIFSAL